MNLHTWWISVLYLPVTITEEYSQRLTIDGEIKWKDPEAIYRKSERGDEFYFDRIVHYKPIEQEEKK